MLRCKPPIAPAKREAPNARIIDYALDNGKTSSFKSNIDVPRSTPSSHTDSL